MEMALTWAQDGNRMKGSVFDVVKWYHVYIEIDDCIVR